MGPGGGGAAFSGGVSNLGNTLGNTGLTGTQLVFAGIGNLTLSQATDLNGGTISISGGTAGAGFSLGVSGGNTAGDTGATGTRVVLAGGNGITLSQATDANGGSITISGVTQSAQTQNLFDLTISGNTAGVAQLVSSGTLTLAGGANITLSQNGNAITVIGGAGGAETQTGISGLANSQTTYTSGTVSLSELGAITIRSTTGNQFQLSVNPQSVQPETQTFVGGIAASNTTYTSGTITITGVGGGVTVSSNTGQRIDISVAAPVAQTGTQFSAGISGGNTSNHSGTVAGRVVLAGGNNVTLSGSTNGASMSITISAAAQTAQTGISSIVASDTTYTSGSVQFTGSGIVTVRSSANQRVVIDASQSVQTQNMVAVTLSGNTSGAQALISSGTMTLAGGNNITVSQNGNAVTISGPNVGGAQTGISGIANSETTYTSGSVTFSQLGAITIRSTTGQHFQFSVDPQSAQSLGMYALGNTTGQSSSTTFDARTVSLRGDGIISLGYSNGSLRISASQSVQPETQTFVAGLANSQTTYTSGTVSMSELGAITIRSTTGNQYQFSVNSQTVQTQGILSAGVSTGGNTLGNTQVSTGSRLVLVGGGIITASQATAAGASTITLSASQSVQPGVQHFVVSNTTFSSGTVSISGFGDVTVNTAANLIRISAPVQTAQTGISGIANSQTTYTSGTVSLSELGAITIRSTTGNQYQFSVNAQTEQTQSRFNLTISGNTAGAGALISSGVMTLAGGNNITLSQAGNAVTISGGAGGGFSAGVSNIGNTVGDTGVSGTRMVLAGIGEVTLSQSTNANGNTVSISAPAQTVESQSIGASNLGNTLGTSGVASGGQVRAVIIGTSNITVSQSVNGASATMSLIGQPSFSAGLSTGGNTQGNTGISGSRLVLVGTNNITLSQNTDANGATISISGQSPAGGAFSGGASNLGNTAGATGISGTQMVLVGSGVMSLSQTTGANGNTVSILAPAQSVLSAVAPLSTSTNGSTISFLGPATSSIIGVSGISVSTNGSTISVMQTTGSGFLTSLAPYDESPIVTGQQGQATLHMMPIRFPEAVAFDRIALGIQISNATNSSNSITLSQWVGIYSRTASSLSLSISTSISTNFTGSGSVGSYSLYGGPKQQTIGWTQTVPEGDWYVAIVMRTTTGGGAGHSISQLCQSKFTNSAWSGLLGVGSNATDQRLLGQGVYSVSTSGMPASIAFTQLQGSGSMVLRPPIWHVRSGTV